MNRKSSFKNTWNYLLKFEIFETSYIITPLLTNHTIGIKKLSIPKETVCINFGFNLREARND